MTFQERLRQLRTARGWSQEALAERLGLSRQAVQKWESGAARPDMHNLVTLSRLFQVSLDWLVTGAEPDDPASGQPEQSASPAPPVPSSSTSPMVTQTKPLTASLTAVIF